jgi:hypothetical protein
LRGGHGPIELPTIDLPTYELASLGPQSRKCWMSEAGFCLEFKLPQCLRSSSRFKNAAASEIGLQLGNHLVEGEREISFSRWLKPLHRLERSY